MIEAVNFRSAYDVNATQMCRDLNSVFLLRQGRDLLDKFGTQTQLSTEDIQERFQNKIIPEMIALEDAFYRLSKSHESNIFSYVPASIQDNRFSPYWNGFIHADNEISAEALIKANPELDGSIADNRASDGEVAGFHVIKLRENVAVLPPIRMLGLSKEGKPYISDVMIFILCPNGAYMITGTDIGVKELEYIVNNLESGNLGRNLRLGSVIQETTINHDQGEPYIRIIPHVEDLVRNLFFYPDHFGYFNDPAKQSLESIAINN